MTQYLIRTLTDSTGHPFTHVTKARDNESYTVIEAESKEEALEKAKKPKGLLEVIPSSFNNYRSISKPVPNRNQAIPPRKDSE
ncbi:DUF1381 domain-containing protein [Staphylococcus saprophyticus]|uniref:DUF1381 domain-containing protein n=1 Tax=Staphylococcus saprophyticus TaxID=29385 RepID=UPI0018883E8B|nr:DUF1381 domain-containing protein [Staphylococcus saprophyticus]MBF2751541.1 DUF1381 domain-containing protein [Staphylococcus saprophyticus]